ncbi:MAG: nitroreductase family protein [Candidatus Cloacimonetes bacterium]|nr:nitroreductase family protein [Candidatus Cloacimonadota bacterium]
MDFQELADNRRAYRSLEKCEITPELVDDLASTLKLAPSCFNNQPWQFVFVYDEPKLKEMHESLAKGNEWAQKASMMIAVFAKKESDCNIKIREYFLFDTGMATAYLILRATELGLIAHPIAGYSHKKVREILGIPEGNIVIALVIIGKKSDTLNPDLSERQKRDEKQRPQRKANELFVHHNIYKDLDN